MKNYAPIGLGTQLTDLIEGAESGNSGCRSQKKEYVTANVDKISKINVSKVFNVTVDGDNLQ